ncbi:MAG: hypothetical protein H7296_09105 [Bacteroidia bacterium]|nr:hypothetical protein [Bacteroidia bacterium]
MGPVQTIVITAIEKVLAENGLITKTFIGQLHIKCHIGISLATTDVSYCAGIIIYDALHCESNDLLEQYLFKPDLLLTNGWKIIQVYSNDWYDDETKWIVLSKKHLKLAQFNRGDFFIAILFVTQNKA